MNKKIYVANLPMQASEPELKTLFSNAGEVVFRQNRRGPPDRPTQRDRLCGDVHPVGGPKGHFHASSNRLQGKYPFGKRSHRQTRF